jgi:hypothetical protein
MFTRGGFMRALCAITGCAFVLAGGVAAAQVQTVIVDRPLAACSVPAALALSSATLTEAQAAAVISAAMNIATPDPQTYYIVHATEFTPGRTTVAEERWYVYHAGWVNRTALNWFSDARRAQRFTETRVMGSERVSLVYLYVNVPAYSTLESRNAIAAHFRRQRASDRAIASNEEREQLLTRLRGSLTAAEEQKAQEEATKAAASVAPGSPDQLELVVQLETERFIKAFGNRDSTIANEITFVNEDTGESLVGLSPTLATSSTFGSLNTLFYKIVVTKKTPANLDNLQTALKFAFTGQAGEQTRLYVRVENAAVCAGENMAIKHIPSNMDVFAFNKNDKNEDVQRSKQQFDNEGRYWWDVSFALPLKSREDLTIDVDAGQVAAKKVEKTDLFAMINLGWPRDTKKLQWQLVPSFVYGMPITGQPLKHHLVGLSLGLNYVQVIVGRRFDQITEVSTTEQGGTPVGVESPPAQGEKWKRDWVWALNIPVGTVVKLFTKNVKK